jgi:hypothetical protein
MRKNKLPTPPNHEKVHEQSNCAIFGNFHYFEPPDHLIQQLTSGNVVIFAGAGVSTEVRTVFPFTFYDEIHTALGLGGKNKPSFPALMSMYCKKPDGRRKLLEALRRRLAYISAFPELFRLATRFHREISTLSYINTYITTNWDNYFETICGATPFVTADDFAFWNVKGRKVFKIHGSVSNYGSVVATNEDYRRAQNQLERGALGSALKLLLATKTIVYVGYSFSDYDFLSIQRYIARELREVAPTAYIVTIDRTVNARLQKLGLIPIFTDATCFIQVLKKHLQKDGHLLPDSQFDAIHRVLARVGQEHRRLFDHFCLKRTPEILFAAAYQDGLTHAFERMLAMAHTGEYSIRCEVTRQVEGYEKIRKDNLRRRRYDDVAYIHGYLNGLFYLLLDDRRRKALPFYFGFGMPDTQTIGQYKKALARNRGGHKAATSLAKLIVAKDLGASEELHHRPFLDWSDSL